MYRLIYTGSKDNCLEIKQILFDLGHKSVSIVSSERTINDDIECDLVYEFFRSEYEDDAREYVFWTATQIQEFLEHKSKKTLNIKNVGSALKKLGFKRISIKTADGRFTKGYKLFKAGFLYKERLARFEKAKQQGLVVFGIDISNYDNPDDFNKACQEAKEKSTNIAN